MSELLRFEQVDKVFERGRHRERVLTDVSFCVGHGQVVAVSGDRFGGKTTLLRLAAGMILPTKGTVWLDEVDMASLTPSARDALLTDQVSWCGHGGPGLELELRDFIALPALMEDRTSTSPRHDCVALLQPS